MAMDGYELGKALLCSCASVVLHESLHKVPSKIHVPA